jgi:hypothetical protein
MKKTILFAALLLVAVVAIAAPKPRTFIQNVQYYFGLFKLDLNPYLVGSDLFLEDTSTKNANGILYQTSYMLSSVEFMLNDLRITISDTSLQSITYSMFIILDAKIDKSKEPNLRYDVYMDRGWLMAYFRADNQERTKMLTKLFDKYYQQWSPTQKSKI